MCTFRVMLAAALTAVLAVVGQGQGGCGPAPCDGDGGTATTAGATCGATQRHSGDTAYAACSQLCWCGADCGKCEISEVASGKWRVAAKKECAKSVWAKNAPPGAIVFDRCVNYTKTDWFSEEKRQAGVELSGMSQVRCFEGACTGLAATGMQCQGRFCDNVGLSLMNIKVDWSSLEIAAPGWISDNKGTKYDWNKDRTDGLSADCPDGYLVTRVQCRGTYCDDLRLICGQPESEEVLDPQDTGIYTLKKTRRLLWKVDTVGEVQSDWFSEEGKTGTRRGQDWEYGSQECPLGFVLTGVECQENKQESGACISNCGHYCDNKRIRCRPIRPNIAALGGKSSGIANAMQMANAQAPSVHCNATCRAALYPEEDKTKRDKAFTGAISGAVSPSSFCAFALAVLSLWL